MKNTFIIALTLIMLFTVGCQKNKEDISVDNQREGIVSDITVNYDEIIDSLFIGEFFESGYSYIESYSEYNKDNGHENESTFPDMIEFYSIEREEVYQAFFVEEMEVYVQNLEPESKYFFQPFSQQIHHVGRYEIEDNILDNEIGVGISKYTITNMDFSISGKTRPYSEEELERALKIIKKDSEIKEEYRTLEYMDIDDTIIGADQICKMTLDDSNIEILLSEYFTHGFEYAGNVYVIDILEDGAIMKTCEKFILDGPY